MTSRKTFATLNYDGFVQMQMEIKLLLYTGSRLLSVHTIGDTNILKYQNLCVYMNAMLELADRSQKLPLSMSLFRM